MITPEFSIYMPKEITEAKEKKLIAQFEGEYQLCYDATDAKRAEGLKRLKLYNNQKRDKSKVGDPLLFVVHQTILAALYEDRLSSVFQGNEEGDEDTAENITQLAKHDYRVMGKDELDYEWDWDASFFGEGYMFMHEFDRETKTPIAELWDPMTTILDPRRSSINGNQQGSGAAQFFGREVGLTKSILESNSSYFNVDKLKKSKEIQGLTEKAKLARREAQGHQVTDSKEEALTENYEYKIIHWFTHIKGEKYLLSFGNSRNLLIRCQKLNADKWPLMERRIFPMSHGDVVSVPDLVEDKQRARAVMINLGIESAKADLYPMYLFNKRKIPNPNDLNFAFNKFVPVKGDVNNALTPIQKSTFHSQVNLMLNILDTASQKAIAAPEIAQGVQPRQSRTLGETEMVGAGAQTRHSLGAKVFGWSEKKFLRQWYFIYKKNFQSEIDEKIIRIQGPLASEWRTLTRENTICNIDPDIHIEIASIAEAKRRQGYADFSLLAQIAMQDPQTNRRYVLRNLGKLSGLSRVETNFMFPLTIDEMRAEDENQKINDNKLPEVKAIDDDVIHIETHNKASDTPAKLAHIEAHKIMLFHKKENPELFMPAEQTEMQGFNPVNQPAEIKETRTEKPQELKEESLS